MRRSQGASPLETWSWEGKSTNIANYIWEVPLKSHATSGLHLQDPPCLSYFSHSLIQFPPAVSFSHHGSQDSCSLIFLPTGYGSWSSPLLLLPFILHESRPTHFLRLGSPVFPAFFLAIPIKNRSIYCFPTMSRNVRLRQATSTRQQPLLKNSRSFVGEVIGETTAECAVICCCFPCAVANLLVLAIYKVPAGLCRRALRRHRKRMLPPRRRRCSSGCDDIENQIHPNCILDVSDLQTSPELDKELQQLEKEMWERFYGTGFWRSPSQRESPDAITSTKPRIPISTTWEMSKVPYV